MKANSESKTMLSVVIPVFNVETTIERAVKSVFKNEFHNFEIILINDGSTDNSGEICEKLSKASDKIYCYHKENGGLSSARNYGIKKARGKLISFLDSDDYYLSGCLDRVIKDYYENSPDIISFGLKKGENEWDSIEFVENKKIGCNNVEAVELLFKSKAVDFYAWNKVFKKSLFTSIEFPEEKLYEDMVPIYQVFKTAQTVDILNFAGIFYFQNGNSIVYQDFSLRQYDNIDQRKILLKNIREDYPHFVYLAYIRLVDGYLSTGFKIAMSKRNNLQTLEAYNVSKREIADLFSEMDYKKRIPILKRIALFLYRTNLSLYGFLYKKVLKK